MLTKSSEENKFGCQIATLREKVKNSSPTFKKILINDEEIMFSSIKILQIVTKIL